MKQAIDDYLQAKIGAEKDFQPDWEAHRYLIRGKMFAMHATDKNGKEILTLKLLPEHGEELRELHKDKIIAGYYMNKTHWNSIYLAENLPDELIKKMIDESYRLILGGFSRKVQLEIIEGAY
ncbi:MAG: MmcQ/YjbR family DNA-binding protein [Streptococcaceae bacterium]|nr:MmcQ/YjbR family DNA-binding protein [Streptococcaceae bacterium]